MKPSYMNSMLSQLVFIIVIAVVIMQLFKFYQDGKILDLFNSLFSMIMGAYFQRSMGSNQKNDSESEKKTEEVKTNKKSPLDSRDSV